MPQGCILLICLYVDDALIAYSSKAALQSLHDALTESGYELKTEDPAEGYLGAKIDTDKHTIRLSQEAYIRKVAQEFGFAESRPQYTPMETGLALRPAEEGETLADPKAYQSLLGSLLWLASYTRPDVSHAVSVLGQFASKPTVLHKRALVRIGRYVLTTCTQGLRYRPCARHSLEFFSDASYGDRAPADKGAIDVVRVISRHHVLVAHVLESRRNRRRESLLVRNSVGSKWIVHWLVGSVGGIGLVIHEQREGPVLWHR